MRIGWCRKAETSFGTMPLPTWLALRIMAASGCSDSIKPDRPMSRFAISSAWNAQRERIYLSRRSITQYLVQAWRHWMCSFTTRPARSGRIARLTEAGVMKRSVALLSQSKPGLGLKVFIAIKTNNTMRPVVQPVPARR